MKWTRSRTASALALGTASALLLAACGDAEPGEATDDPTTEAPSATPTGPKEDITLTLSYWGNFYPDSLVQAYEEANPHVTLDLQAGEHGATHENLQQQLIAGSGAAHVQAIDADFITGFVAQADQFVNLLDLGAGVHEEKYLEWKWADASTADGSTTIGLGSDVGGLAMCYRRDLFEEAGLPSERAEVEEAIGDTWEGFIALGEQYTDATGDGFVDNATNINTPALTQLQTGYYTENNELNMEPTKQAFDIALDVIDAGISANIAPWSPEWNTGFENGEFAVLACPAWMLGYISGQVSADSFAGAWDVADIPGPGGNWGGSWYTIPAQFDDYTTQEAYNFIEWVIQPDQQIAIFEEFGNLPSQNSLYDDPGILAYESEFFSNAPVGEIFTQSAADIPGSVYYAPKHNAIRQAVESVLNEVQAGNVSSEDAWEAAVEAAEEADAA